MNIQKYQAFITVVEQRAVKNANPVTSLTWEQVWKERRLELAMEGDRWYDFVRVSYYNPDFCVNELKTQHRGPYYGLNSVYKAYFESGNTDWSERSDTSSMFGSVRHPIAVSYAYRMDAPAIRKRPQTYAMGVSELCVLPDGQLLVLEREVYVPKSKIGASCQCKLYLVNPAEEQVFPMSASFASDDVPYVRKTLLTQWSTRLTLLGRSFANYEGMCLGPQLADGSQVLILLSDSQDQYAGVLKDWFKTIVLAK